MKMNTRDLLLACREKLQLYRKAHTGEYIGGMEFTALTRELDAVLELCEGRARMTPKEAVERLDSLPGQSGEDEAHSSADNILLLTLRDLGHHEVADAYERLQRRSTFYYS